MPSTPAPINQLNWKETEYDPAASVKNTVRETDWQKLCQLASDLNDGLSCIPLNKTTNGLNNLVRLLQFSDMTRWVARVALRRSAADSAKLRSEVHVMQFIWERSSLPVPKVFAYEADEHNSVGVPFILMEFLPGNTAMDAAGGYEVHRGQIPSLYRPTFYRSVAECHVKLAALRLSKIGTIHRTQSGEYEVGPFPDIGGPFTTATAFFEAWAEHTRFPRGKDQILELMKGGPAEQVLDAINVFPARFKAIASRLLHNDDGPFPLCHPDFLHSNIIVNENFNVLGVIDWEGACTLPLELLRFPRFLDAMPLQFDSPENYDQDGRPVDGSVRQRWEERRDYVQMIRSIEDQDNALSTCLSNEKGLALSYCMTAYREGKLGLYDRVLDELEGDVGRQVMM